MHEVAKPSRQNFISSRPPRKAAARGVLVHQGHELMKILPVPYPIRRKHTAKSTLLGLCTGQDPNLLRSPGRRGPRLHDSGRTQSGIIALDLVDSVGARYLPRTRKVA